MTDKTIPFSALDLAPILKELRQKKPSRTRLISHGWLKSAVITATGWQNITT